MEELRFRILGALPSLVSLLVTLAVLVSCGGHTEVSFTSTGGTGRVTVSVSDPPTCKGPLAPGEVDFNQVWVTITQVRVHISASVDGDASGWVDLIDLRDNPMQIDLLDTSDTACILATLGSTSSLAPGNYQQIRLHLLSNNPTQGAATPSPNACEGTGGFNCVELAATGERKILLLSSEAQTGIKIPPGRIAGGAIVLEAGQSADINIEFNACNSIVRQDDGDFRLLPALHAGEVSVITETIRGRVVDTATGQPIPNATIVVLAEQPEDDGVDRVIMQTLASVTEGTFTFCPLPPGNYDIVVAAISGTGVTYGATITFAVPAGTTMGDIPLEPQKGLVTSPGAIEGLVTTQDVTSNPTGSDVALSALQRAAPEGASAVLVTVPLFGNSTANVATEVGNTCPLGTACANYRLFVSASNPKLGTFNASGTNYSAPVAGDVFYSINARAFIPGSGSLPNCLASSLITDRKDTGDQLTVTPEGTTTAEPLAFTSCQPGF